MATAASSILLPIPHRGMSHHLPRPQLSPLQIIPNPSRRCSVRLCARPHWTPYPGGGGGAAADLEAAQMGKVRIRIRLDHQVEFGETVVVFGSHRPLGSWRRGISLAWTEGGWVTDVLLDGGDFVEYKFVIVSDGGETKVWEDGENRVLEVPRTGLLFDVVCRWNMTEEAVDMICVIPDDVDDPADEVEVEEEVAAPAAPAEEEEEEEEGVAAAGGAEQGAVFHDKVVEQSPAVERRLGIPPAAATIVDSSEQKSPTEMERARVAAPRPPAGLPPVKVQVGERRRSNWWRQLIPPETSYDMIDVVLSLSQGIFLLISALHRAV